MRARRLVWFDSGILVVPRRWRVIVARWRTAFLRFLFRFVPVLNHCRTVEKERT